jgi:MFS family permease
MPLNSVLLRSTVVAALGGLLFGFDTVVISGTTQALTDLFHLSPLALGMTVSSALAGTIVGSMLAGIPGDAYGRRDSLRILAVLYFVSAVGCGFARNWTALVIFRIIGGLAIGGSSVLGPMYIAEIAPAKYRGRLVGLFQFNVVFGILLAYFSNYLMGILNLGAAEWRWKLGIAALPAAFFLVMLFGIPRSPRWLAKLTKRGKCFELQAKRIMNRNCRISSRRSMPTIPRAIRSSAASTVFPFSWPCRLPCSISFPALTRSFITWIRSLLKQASIRFLPTFRPWP